MSAPRPTRVHRAPATDRLALVHALLPGAAGSPPAPGVEPLSAATGALASDDMMARRRWSQDFSRALPADIPALPWRRIGAYTGVGIVSGLANVALFHASLEAHAPPPVAWALSYEVGGLLAFALHRRVTWRDRRVGALVGGLRQFGRAQGGNLVSLVVSLALFAVLLRAGLPGEEANAAGLAAGFALNFLLADHYIYGLVGHRQGWHRPRWARGGARALHRRGTGASGGAAPGAP